MKLQHLNKHSNSTHHLSYSYSQRCEKLWWSKQLTSLKQLEHLNPTVTFVHVDISISLRPTPLRYWPRNFRAYPLTLIVCVPLSLYINFPFIASLSMSLSSPTATCSCSSSSHLQFVPPRVTELTLQWLSASFNGLIIYTGLHMFIYLI